MKNTYRFRTPILFFALLITAGSCKRDDKPVPRQDNTDQSLLGIIENYLKVATVKADGTFIFQSNLTNNDPKAENIAISGGVFYDKSGNAQTGGGSVSIGGQTLSPNSKGTYGFDKILPQKELYGTNVTFTLHPPANHIADTRQSNGVSPSGTVTTTLYSPKPISITNIAPRTQVNLISNQSTTLQWNTDPQNPNGVVVIAQYIPSRYVNKKPLGQGFQTVLSGALNVADNGSTSVPWSFFSQYPQGAHLILWVARGNYTIAENGSYQYKVGGYTAAAVWDCVVPYIPVTATVTAASGFTISVPPTAVTGLGGEVTCRIVGSVNTVPASWATPILVGTISSNCCPTAARTFSTVGTGGGTWSVTVNPNGQVYTKWVSGNLPPSGVKGIVINGSYTQ